MKTMEFIIAFLIPVIKEGGEQLPDSDWFSKLLSSILNAVEETVATFSHMILQASLRILSLIYAPMAVVGVILYVTKINRYLGRDLIYGALLLAFFAEFILPILV